MSLKLIMVAVAVFALSCGKGPGGKGDHPIGGEEILVDSYRCTAKIPSMTEADEPDPVRGFDLVLTVFNYAKGSSAATLMETYTFKDETKWESTASRVFAQDETKHRLETDLLLIRFDSENKIATAFKKYKVGESFDMECGS